MTEVILGLGSNRSFNGKSPLENLLEGVCALSGILSGFSMSSIYKTKPMYVEDQDLFYNMAVKGCVESSLSPYSLLDKIHEIEAGNGRDRSKERRFGERSLDIDIEEFGNLVSDDSVLTLPHPRMKERQFVLIPLLELLNKSADEKKRREVEKALSVLPDQGVIKCSSDVQEKFRKDFLSLK